ncbi:MAG: hypothetical protein ACOCQD_04150 [archaeon]
MKIRNGFVSNSSSSSFIVIGTGNLSIPEHNRADLNVPQDFGGQVEFGWGPETYYDFGSRLNFAYMQTQYASQNGDPLLQKALEHTQGHANSWLHMLEAVLRKNLGVTTINWNLDVDDYSGDGGYIDHQSNAREGENTEMFNSIDELERFLFAEDSMIEEDNDNH